MIIEGESLRGTLRWRSLRRGIFPGGGRRGDVNDGGNMKVGPTLCVTDGFVLFTEGASFRG